MTAQPSDGPLGEAPAETAGEDIATEATDAAAAAGVETDASPVSSAQKNAKASSAKQAAADDRGDAP
ncbi:hypothetical protein ACFQ9X_41255 [Catenulispora yoronensis]